MPLLRTFFRFRTVFLLVMLLSVTGCAEDDSLLSWQSSPAQFTAVFPSEYGEVACAAEWDGDSIRLAVVSPERSAGIAVRCTPAGCTILPADGSEIPISPQAASGLTAVFSLLYDPVPDTVLPQRSADGGNTVFNLSGGTLILGENLLPCAVEYPAQNGETRTVRIENYTLLPPSSEFPPTEEG